MESLSINNQSPLKKIFIYKKKIFIFHRLDKQTSYHTNNTRCRPSRGLSTFFFSDMKKKL